MDSDKHEDKQKSCEDISRAVSLLQEVVHILDVDKSEGETFQNNLSSLSTSLETQPLMLRQYRVSNETNSNSRFSSDSNSSATQVFVSSSGSAMHGRDRRQNLVLENLCSLFSCTIKVDLAPNDQENLTTVKGHKVKETWTHEFFCLADSGCSSVPIGAVKFQLQSASLGERR